MEPIVSGLRQLARETGAAVLLVHHRGKGESEYRGSSVILDQSDLLFTLGRVSGDPEGRHRRKITTSKCRIAEEPGPRWVAIEADRARGLVYVNATDPYEDEDGGLPRDRLRDDVLAALDSVPRSARSIAKAIGRKPNDSTVPRVLRDLDTDGFAQYRSGGWVRHATNPLGSGARGAPPEKPVAMREKGCATPVAHVAHLEATGGGSGS